MTDTKKKTTNTFKNRHIKKTSETKSKNKYPNSNKHLVKYCTVEEILKEFVPKRDKTNSN